MAPKEVIIDTVETKVGADGSEGSWQAFCVGLSSRLGSVRKRKLWTDCELIVGSDRSKIAGHRVLLAAASPVLAAVLYGPLARAQGPVELLEIERDIFEALLDYIYSDSLKIRSCDAAISLYKAAHALVMPQVKDKCRVYLTRYVALKNAVQVFEFSEKFHEKYLMEKCLKIMSNNTSAILSNAHDAAPSTLAHLFALPQLVIESELDLFHAAARWLRARIQPATQVQSDDSESNDQDYDDTSGTDGDRTGKVEDPTYEEEKRLIRNAVQQIRFLTLDPQEFGELDASILLTEAEMLAISMNFISEKCRMPMPEGFSTSRESRVTAIKVTISNLAVFKKTQSEIHHIQNLPWKVKLSRSYDDTLLLRIQCNEDRKVKKWRCSANMTFRVVSQKWNVPPLVHKPAYPSNKKCLFRSISAYWYRYIQTKWHWKTLTDPANGYVKDGCLTVEARLTAEPAVYEPFTPRCVEKKGPVL